MAITTKRKNILAYIKGTTLALINGTGHYNNKIKTITRRIRQPQDFESQRLPAVMIRDDIATEYAPMTAEEYSTGSIESLTDGMGVGIVGIVATGDSSDFDAGKISDAANDLHSDMIIAMLSDTTLGGNCEAVTLVSSRNSLDYAAHNGLAVCFQLYSVNYIFSPVAVPPVT